MVKLVDTRDLKSLGLKGSCRFDPGSGHHPGPRPNDAPFRRISFFPLSFTFPSFPAFPFPPDPFLFSALPVLFPFALLCFAFHCFSCSCGPSLGLALSFVLDALGRLVSVFSLVSGFARFRARSLGCLGRPVGLAWAAGAIDARLPRLAGKPSLRRATNAPDRPRLRPRTTPKRQAPPPCVRDNRIGRRNWGRDRIFALRSRGGAALPRFPESSCSLGG